MYGEIEIQLGTFIVTYILDLDKDFIFINYPILYV